MFGKIEWNSSAACGARARQHQGDNFLSVACDKSTILHEPKHPPQLHVRSETYDDHVADIHKLSMPTMMVEWKPTSLPAGNERGSVGVEGGQRRNIFWSTSPVKAGSGASFPSERQRSVIHNGKSIRRGEWYDLGGPKLYSVHVPGINLRPMTSHQSSGLMCSSL